MALCWWALRWDLGWRQRLASPHKWEVGAALVVFVLACLSLGLRQPVSGLFSRSVVAFVGFSQAFFRSVSLARQTVFLVLSVVGFRRAVELGVAAGFLVAVCVALALAVGGVA